MTDPLRPEVVAPPHHQFTYLILASIGFAAIGTIAAIALVEVSRPVEVEVPAPTAEIPAPVRVAVSDTVLAPPSNEAELVFHAGGATYVKLADLAPAEDGEPARLPRHGAPRLVEDDTGGQQAIASLAVADLPAAQRRFVGTRLRVGNDCTAGVRRFAIVSRLVGDPAYAGQQGETWTPDGVLAAGAAMIVGELDGCDGALARPAALPAMVELVAERDPGLAGDARSALLASAAAAETQRKWHDAEGEGAWYDHATFDTRIVRHPATGVTWVVVHGSYDEGGCGAPEANLWGVFRVDADGALETVEARELELHELDDVLDVDGDGTLELLGRDWLGTDRLLIHADGSEIDRLRMPFYGCPC